MAMLVADALTEDELLATRRERGLDRYDEVWDGMYVMHALPNDEHQQIVNRLSHALTFLIEDSGRGQVRPGVNLSSNPSNWKLDYRCPDVVVFLNDSSAICHGAFWTGGADLAVEILSPRDEMPSKLDFYAKVGTKELLIVDRDPWQLRLHRHDGTSLALAAVAEPEGEVVASQTLPIALRLVKSESRPRIIVQHIDSGQEWTV